MNIAKWNTTFFQAYNNCRHDQALYTALNLANNGFDLRELLDIEEVRRMVEELKGTEINIPTVDFIQPELVDALEALDAAFAAAELSNLLAELSKNVTTPADLDKLADDLEAIRNETDDPTALDTEVAYLRDHYNTSQDAEAIKQLIYTDILEVNQMIGDISFSGILNSLNYSQEVINTQGDVIVGGIVNDTADAAFTSLETFIDDSITDVETTVAQCFPLYNATATVIHAGCVTALYPINGMAYALGWNLFFVMFVLIFAFNVADHFRRPVKPEFGDRHAARIEAYNDHVGEMETLPLPVGARGYKYDPSSGMPPQVNPAYISDDVVYKIPRATSPNVYTVQPPTYNAAVSGGAKVMITDDPVPDYY